MTNERLARIEQEAQLYMESDGLEGEPLREGVAWKLLAECKRRGDLFGEAIAMLNELAGDLGQRALNVPLIRPAINHSRINDLVVRFENGDDASDMRSQME